MSNHSNLARKPEDFGAMLARILTPPKASEYTYPTWLALQFAKAVKGSTIEGHGPFKQSELHGTGGGTRMVLVDESNGQRYEIIVNVMSNKQVQA